MVSDQWPSEAVDTLSSRGRAIAHALALAEAMRSRVKRAILVTVEGSEPSDPNTL